MSSFFTFPNAQKKRKRQSASKVPKKRIAMTKARPAIGKSPARKSAPPTAKKQKQPEEHDESISGSDLDTDDEKNQAPGEEGSDEGPEGSEVEGKTAVEKRLLLAQRYLDKTMEDLETDDVGWDAADIDRDLIAERLQEDVAESKGRVYRRICTQFDWASASRCQIRSDSDTITSVAALPPPDSNTKLGGLLYTASKDGFLCKYRIQPLAKYQYPQTTKKKPKKQAPPRTRPERIRYTRADTRKSKDKTYNGHTGAILSVRASQDGKFVVTGGADRRLVVHDPATMKPLKTFLHHRDAVTALVFRRNTNQVYSASKDRTVKVWEMDNLTYVETLFGHQDDVIDIDAMASERCVTVGARDRTCRYWKVPEESQLVFRGGAVDKKFSPDLDPGSLAHEGSMDRVAMLDEELFVTGSDNGSISLWSTQKKKPLFVHYRAHGIDSPLDAAKYTPEKKPDSENLPPPQPRWITALRSVPYSDMFFSGSWDGVIRIWKLSEDRKKFSLASSLGDTKSRLRETDSDSESIKGIINDFAVFERGERGRDGLCLIAATGREIRLGRWKVLKGARCGVMLFEVPRLPKRENAPPPQANGVNGVYKVAKGGAMERIEEEHGISDDE